MPAAVRLLAALSYDVILVETVGVGQSEIEVAAVADPAVVILNPGAGDAIQAAKAGLLEVADVFVINKADRPGVREARRDLEQMLDLARPGAWRPEIVETTATGGDGISDMWRAMAAHRDHRRMTAQFHTQLRAHRGREFRSLDRVHELPEGRAIGEGG